jgi:hypothetical protein
MSKGNHTLDHSRSLLAGSFCIYYDEHLLYFTRAEVIGWSLASHHGGPDSVPG